MGLQAARHIRDLGLLEYAPYSPNPRRTEFRREGDDGMSNMALLPTIVLRVAQNFCARHTL